MVPLVWTDGGGRRREAKKRSCQDDAEERRNEETPFESREVQYCKEVVVTRTNDTDQHAP